jgi:predicted permease
VEERLDDPAPDGDLPSTLAFVLLFVLPASSAVALFELLRVLPRGFLDDDVAGFIGLLLLVPAAVTALASLWACRRCGVERATAWSIVAAASVLAAVCSFSAIMVFGFAGMDSSD